MRKLFCDQLRSERKKRGMTAQELADMCGISRSYVTLIENGARMPGKTIIPLIAKSLKLKKAVVLSWYLEDIRIKMISD